MLVQDLHLPCNDQHLPRGSVSRVGGNARPLYDRRCCGPIGQPKSRARSQPRQLPRRKTPWRTATVSSSRLLTAQRRALARGELVGPQCAPSSVRTICSSSSWDSHASRPIEKSSAILAPNEEGCGESDAACCHQYDRDERGQNAPPKQQIKCFFSKRMHDLPHATIIIILK